MRRILRRVERFQLTDQQKTRVALQYQALQRQTNPAYTVWIDEGALFTRELLIGERTRKPWMELVAELRASEVEAA